MKLPSSVLRFLLHALDPAVPLPWHPPLPFPPLPIPIPLVFVRLAVVLLAGCHPGDKLFALFREHPLQQLLMRPSFQMPFQLLWTRELFPAKLAEAHAALFLCRDLVKLRLLVLGKILQAKKTRQNETRASEPRAGLQHADQTTFCNRTFSLESDRFGRKRVVSPMMRAGSCATSPPRWPPSLHQGHNSKISTRRVGLPWTTAGVRQLKGTTRPPMDSSQCLTRPPLLLRIRLLRLRLLPPTFPLTVRKG